MILALTVVMTLTQCKKKNDDGENTDGTKVKVTCAVPMNNGGKSEFDNPITDGTIQWSDGTERIYLAIPEAQQIVELVSDEHQGSVDVLTFTGTVGENVLNGDTYEIWYFGKQKPNVSETDGVINSISGSIAAQTGNLSDLGNYHIAKATVTAETNGEEVVLSLDGVLETQIAIAYLDLSDITKLEGDAIVGTDYTLQYNEDEFVFSVVESNTANINVTDGTGTSYVVLFPNNKYNVYLVGDEEKMVTFKNGIEANRVYYKAVSDVEYYPLVWKDYVEPFYPTVETITVNGVTFNMIKVEGNGNDISDYYIGETEVTQELWQAVMGSNPSCFTGNPQRPVEMVSWNYCQDFITQLNMLTGKDFRLPTNAEWEYAAKGGSQSKGYTYSGSNNIDNVAWYKGNSNNTTHEVKSKLSNEIGLYDMSGNVSEFTSDQYCYGGAFCHESECCKVTYHFSVKYELNTTVNDMGFRLCLNVPYEPGQTGVIDGHGYVDLGLPSGLKWATCNVGASSPEEYGGYFAWGEIDTKISYTEDNSVTYGRTISDLQSQEYIDGYGYLTPSHDAARANLGGNWRMPTLGEIEELTDNCTWTWITLNGVSGYKVASKTNSNSIFLPAAGIRNGTSLQEDGRQLNYWSSKSHEGSMFADYFRINSGGSCYLSCEKRCYGMTVRPVIVEGNVEPGKTE